MDKIKVGVVFGGRSEHTGSVENALDVIDCLKKTPYYEVIPIYITKQGGWQFFKENLPLPMDSATSEINLLIHPTKKGLIALPPNDPSFIPLDIVFPIVQGDKGEDGCIPGLLELANIPYVGSGVLSSALCMDKIAFKMILDRHDLPQTPFLSTTRCEWKSQPEFVFDACKNTLELPWFVKPANMGSSIGITKVNKFYEFNAAMGVATQFDTRILIEQAVQSPIEIEVAIMGNEFPKVSRTGEVSFTGEFFSYEIKYFGTDTKILIPSPRLLPKTEEKVRSLALQVYEMMNCSGFARIDFLVQEADQKIFISEINTIPGLRRDRMFPQLFMAEGLSYSLILDHLIKLGFESYEEKQKNKVL